MKSLLTSCVVGTLAVGASFNQALAFGQSGQGPLDQQFLIPSQWQATLSLGWLELPNDYFKIFGETFENPMDDLIITELSVVMFYGSPGRKYSTTYSSLAGGPSIVGESLWPVDFDPGNTVGGFIEDHLPNGVTFDSPIAIADLNSNGALDAGDVSLYGVLDPGAFVSFANQVNFPLGSTWTTDPTGQVWSGLTFFLDAAHTMLYGSGQILVVDQILEVPAPATICLLALSGLVSAVGRRRRK